MRNTKNDPFIIAAVVMTCKIYKGGYKPANVAFLRHNKTLAQKYYAVIDNRTVIRSATLHRN